MYKKPLIVIAICAACLAFSQTVSPTDESPLATGVPDPCESTATGAGGHYLVCPSGDGDRFDGIGSVIDVEILDGTYVPIPGIPAADFWLVGCNYELLLLGGGYGINADGPTDAIGRTTISGAMTAGGCDIGLAVVIQGIEIYTTDCSQVLCLPYEVRSPDHSGPGKIVDGKVDIIDFADFASEYMSPPKPYNPCIDFNWDDAVDLIDFSIFAQHFGH